jgi:hypothetical protein
VSLGGLLTPFPLDFHDGCCLDVAAHRDADVAVRFSREMLPSRSVSLCSSYLYPTVLLSSSRNAVPSESGDGLLAWDRRFPGPDGAAGAVLGDAGRKGVN